MFLTDRFHAGSVVARSVLLMLLITVEITSSISMLSPRLIRKAFHWSEQFVPYEEEI